MTSKSKQKLKDIAKRVAWFDEPESVLQDTDVFLAHVMTYGTLEDVVATKTIYGLDRFEQALESAAPGIFDERSWAYWNRVCGRVPTPPLPSRRFE